MNLTKNSQKKLLIDIVINQNTLKKVLKEVYLINFSFVSINTKLYLASKYKQKNNK